MDSLVLAKQRLSGRLGGVALPESATLAQWLAEEGHESGVTTEAAQAKATT